MKLYLKKKYLIFWFRFFAIMDVLFSDRFELRTYKKGSLMARTRFDKNEILNAKNL